MTSNNDDDGRKFFETLLTNTTNTIPPQTYPYGSLLLDHFFAIVMSTSSSSSASRSRLALPKALTLLLTLLGLTRSFHVPRATKTYTSPPVLKRPRITSAECRDTRLWSGRDTLDEESPSLDEKGVPRLHLDLVSLMRWIETSGGTFDAEVGKNAEGWSLCAKDKVEAGTVLLKIPKSLCIYANPSLNVVPLVDNVQQLMSSLDSSQWRARLAVALLSERVRSVSHFRAYLRNLPFEFWGVPVFYSSQEFSIMQDLALMQRTRDRCRFLSEFAVSVLAPLHNTPRDPFSKHCADVNALGWGFASAASRALRNPDVIKREVTTIPSHHYYTPLHSSLLWDDYYALP